MLQLLALALLTSQASAWLWQTVTSTNRYPPEENMMFFSSTNFGRASVCRYRLTGAYGGLAGRNNNNRCYVKYNNDEDFSLPFDVLGYDVRADLLNFETNPSLNTYVSRGIRADDGSGGNGNAEYVCADSRYGIGSLWAGDSRCYIHSAGNGIAVGSSQALTVARATLYEFYDMTYNLNDVTASNRAPIFGNVDRNTNDSPNSNTVELTSSVRYVESYEWSMNEYFYAKTRIKVKARIPVYFSGSWSLSAEYSFEYNYEEACEKELFFEKKATYIIPAYNRCELYAYIGQADMNVPYSGMLRSTYPSGTTEKSIEGIYTGLPVVESDSVFSCQPLTKDGEVIKGAPQTTDLAQLVSETETVTVKNNCRL